MKTLKSFTVPFVILILLAVCALAFTGCKIFGIDPAPPNKVEQAIFQTITNYVDVPVQKVVTNLVTREVMVVTTNTVGQIVQATNFITLPQYETVWVTNTIPQYENHVKESVKADITSISGLLNFFFPGAGPIASSGLLMLLGGWAHLRSSKRSRTSEALSQEVETMLEFVKSLPNGAANKEALTNWLQAHQVETGVAEQVLGLLQTRVDNPAAKEAAAEIAEILGKLQAAK